MSEPEAYTGVDNLEVMSEAVNYNGFLTDMVMSHVKDGSDRVLDFGAGAGTFALMLAERGVRPDCVEPDQALQGALDAAGLTIVGDQEPGKDTYDLVYSLNVLEHIQDDQSACNDIARWLRPGGVCLIYVPAFELLFSAMDVKVRHFRRYRRREVERLLRSAGLTVETSSYCDPMGFMAALAYKSFHRGDGSLSPRSVGAFDRFVFPFSRLSQPVTRKFFGKNVLVTARKPQAS